MYERRKWIDECKGQDAMCTIPISFSNVEGDLDKNEFNIFLHLYHSRLIDYLMEFFCLNKSGIECFLFDEFSYSGCDWYTGQQWSVPLQEQIEYRQF